MKSLIPYYNFFDIVDFRIRIKTKIMITPIAIIPRKKAKIKIIGTAIVSNILVFKLKIFRFVNFTNMKIRSRITAYRIIL